MARIASGDTNSFSGRAEIERYLLGAIAANQQRKLGTEAEFFFLKRPADQPITISDGQIAFRTYASEFTKAGYDVVPTIETIDGRSAITGLDVAGFGAISLETSHGFEYASDVCDSSREIRDKNALFLSITQSVGQYIGYDPVFRGRVPQYSAAVPVHRSRSILSRQCFRDRFGSRADAVAQIQGSVASLQVNVDTCGDAFHEVYRVLLIVEPALALYYSDGTGRNHEKAKRYTPLVPEQTLPIIGVWASRNNRDAVQHIVDRLLKVRIPFLPDPVNEGTYKAEPLNAQRQPTLVQQLLDQGRLDERTLKNALSFLFMSPSLRRPAVLELRGIDTQGDADQIGKIAQRVSNAVYDDEARHSLLSAYDHFTMRDIAKLHAATGIRDVGEALRVTIQGKPIGLLVGDIVARTEPAFSSHSQLARLLTTGLPNMESGLIPAL